jgi:hypothetical protein
MRRLFVVVFILVILSSPISLENSTTTNADSPTVVAQHSQQLQRVYGVNLAYEIYSQTSLTSYESFVQDLSDIGIRFVRNIEINVAARIWVEEQLTSLSNGRIEIDLVGIHDNIVGRLPGYLPGNNPAFVVSAHFDSGEESPGANDNGSGVAVVLELARILSQYEWPLDIYFCAFNAAVPTMFGTPLQGSIEVADMMSNAGIDILAMYNVDSILYNNRFGGLDDSILLGYADVSPYQTSHYWADLVKMLGKFYTLDLIRPMPSGSFPLWSQSDHFRFYQEGYHQVVCAYEADYQDDEISGSADDVFTQFRYNYYIGKELTGLIGASMAFTMGREYGENVRHYYKGMIYSEATNTFHYAISATTVLNVTCRWWGSGINLTLYGPSWNIIDSVSYPEPSAWEFQQALNTPILQPGLYHLIVQNPYSSSLGFETIIEYDSDIDANGVLDKNEYWLDTQLFQTDSDSDALSDAMEIILLTDINLQDSDLDNLPDGWEYEYDFDPRYSNDGSDDADNDGLTNYEEFLAGLNPRNSDSDMDLIPDLFEVENGLDPLVDDADLDPDDDGKTNLEEYLEGTDPQVVDQETLDLVLVAIPSSVLVLVGASVYLSRKYSDLMGS